MTEAILQILLVLAFLAIGLISVTFPIFAISVNYLSQEKWEGEKERKKRIEELKKKIQEQIKQLEGKAQDSEKTKALTKEIADYQSELKGTELRSTYLSAKGAVGVPVILLAIALGFCGAGINYYYEAVQNPLPLVDPNLAIICGILSGSFIAGAVYRLYKTISAVEYASFRTEKTVEFEIGFGTDHTLVEKAKVGKKTSLFIGAKTDETDVLNWVLSVIIPRELHNDQKYDEARVAIGDSENYNYVTLFHDFIPKGYEASLRMDITPEKLGSYKIMVEVKGRGLCKERKELTLEVE